MLNTSQNCKYWLYEPKGSASCPLFLCLDSFFRKLLFKTKPPTKYLASRGQLAEPELVTACYGALGRASGTATFNITFHEYRH